VRGQENASKLYVLKCAACNLGLLLRKVWGLIKPRVLVGAVAAAVCALWAVLGVLAWLPTPVTVVGVTLTAAVHVLARRARAIQRDSKRSFV
jgi:hypothetical protein